MANVDFTEQIANFRSAIYGEDVRESLIDVAEAVETACNNQLITVDSTLSHAGQGADAEAVGDAIDELRGDLGNLNDLETEAKTDLVSAINEAASSGGESAEIKVEGTKLIINTNVTNGNEVSY